MLALLLVAVFPAAAHGSSPSNGNIHQQKITASGLPGGFLTQTYTYDALNRLGSITEGSPGGSWSHSFGFDRYGNRWVSGTTGHTLHASTPIASTDFAAATNRLLKNAATFDNAGNLLSETFVGSMAYDAANHQTTFTDPVTSAVTTYAYDGAGNRVRKITAAATTVYVYNAFGRLAAEYASVAPTGPTGTQYRTTDHLGSTRLVTNAAAGVISRRDFFPFGEEIPANATFGSRHLVTDGQANTTYNDPSGYRQQFTDKGRDEESQLDYFLARYYSGPLGRFLSVDPANAGARPDDPRTWNSYAYVSNNPMAFVDPDGRAIKYAAGLNNEQVVRDSVAAILDTPNTNSQLSGFVGPDAPDVTIRSNDLGAPKETDLGGGRTLTTTVKGNMTPHIQNTKFSDGSKQTLFTGATITISTRASKGETPGIMIHETFHLQEAQQDPVQFSQDRKNEAGTKHDDRPQEQRANDARNANLKQIKKRIKQIKKARKEEE